MSSHPERALRGCSAQARAVIVDRGDERLLAQALVALEHCGVAGSITVLCTAARAAVIAAAAPQDTAPQNGLGVEVRPVPTGTVAQALTVLAQQAAEPGSGPLVLLDAGLVISPVAMLDVLDHPGRRTAAWVLDGAGPGPVWPAVRRGLSKVSLVESVAAGHLQATAATGAALGLLRVDPADLSAASARWSAAADVPELAAEPATDAFAGALVALVRGAVPVDAVPLAGWDVAAAVGPTAADAALSRAGARPDDWRRRLAEATRPVDGFYSIFVVRHASRWLTWRLLPTGVAPNTVTVASFGIGVTAALACAVGGWGWLIAASLLLQLSLVLDCVDGEIARYTRRFSPLGAWLDVTGDRIKEYGIYAGLAVSGARRGHDLWLWAVLALALVAYRHFVDYGHGVSVRAGHRPQASQAPLTQPDDGFAAANRTSRGGQGSAGLSGMIAATDATSGYRAVHWLKKVLHLPIGERSLLVSLTLLTGRPVVVLATLVVLEVLSALYTTGGRVLRSVASA